MKSLSQRTVVAVVNHDENTVCHARANPGEHYHDGAWSDQLELLEMCLDETIGQTWPPCSVAGFLV